MHEEFIWSVVTIAHDVDEDTYQVALYREPDENEDITQTCTLFVTEVTAKTLTIGDEVRVQISKL